MKCIIKNKQTIQKFEQDELKSYGTRKYLDEVKMPVQIQQKNELIQNKIPVLFIDVHAIKVAISYVPHNKCSPLNPVTYAGKPRQLIEKLCATMKFKKSFISKSFFSACPGRSDIYFIFYCGFWWAKDEANTNRNPISHVAR